MKTNENRAQQVVLRTTGGELNWPWSRAGDNYTLKAKKQGIMYVLHLLIHEKSKDPYAYIEATHLPWNTVHNVHWKCVFSTHNEKKKKLNRRFCLFTLLLGIQELF